MMPPPAIVVVGTDTGLGRFSLQLFRPDRGGSEPVLLAPLEDVRCPISRSAVVSCPPPTASVPVPLPASAAAAPMAATGLAVAIEGTAGAAEAAAAPPSETSDAPPLPAAARRWLLELGLLLLSSWVMLGLKAGTIREISADGSSKVGSVEAEDLRCSLPPFVLGTASLPRPWTAGGFVSMPAAPAPAALFCRGVVVGFGDCVVLVPNCLHCSRVKRGSLRRTESNIELSRRPRRRWVCHTVRFTLWNTSCWHTKEEAGVMQRGRGSRRVANHPTAAIATAGKKSRRSRGQRGGP